MSVEQDIISAMLIATGEAPVNSENSSHPSAIQARAWYERKNKEFQQRGWWFNTEYNLTLSPNEENKIIVPEGTLEITVHGNTKYVKRGQYLYDPVNHTFEFLSSVQANIVILIAPDDLPAKAAAALTALCVYDYFVSEDGNSGTVTKLKEDLMIAKAELANEERKVNKINAFKSPGVAALVNRLVSVSSGNPVIPGG